MLLQFVLFAAYLNVKYPLTAIPIKMSYAYIEIGSVKLVLI